MAKEIIIDGVDVSGCDFLVKEDDYCSYSGEYRAYKGQCSCSDEEMCKDHPNCFYKKALKRLARKEQECEELKSDLTDLSKIIDCKNGTILTFKEQLDQLKADNEELKRQHESDKGLITSTGKMNYQLIQEYDKLKAENEELKKTIMYKCPQCGDEYLSPIGASLYEENNKLKQTLAEIKEIANKTLWKYSNLDDVTKYNMFDKILQKIK